MFVCNCQLLTSTSKSCLVSELRKLKDKPKELFYFYPISFFETLPLNLGSYMITTYKEFPLGQRNSIYKDKKCKKLLTIFVTEYILLGLLTITMDKKYCFTLGSLCVCRCTFTNIRKLHRGAALHFNK